VGPVLVLLGAAALPVLARGEEAARRGPLEVRDEWLLAQSRLTLPSTSPDPLGKGETRLRLHLDWGNDFGWSQDRAGESPKDRRFLVDGEHRSLGIDLRHGLRDDLDLAFRLPIHWRGGGFLDDVIDGFHRAVTRPLGLPDNDRGRFATNRFRVEGRDQALRRLALTSTGSGVGNLELDVRWACAGSADRPWTAALVGRVVLPTATGPFRTGGVDAAGQAVVARRLGRRWDVYLGGGASRYGRVRVGDFVYRRWRASGFLAVEWRAFSALSLVVEADAGSRLVANVARLPGVHSYLTVGGRLLLAGATVLEGGFRENIVHQQATTDFGVFFGLGRRF
jgi:hypothetical protein